MKRIINQLPSIRALAKRASTRLFGTRQPAPFSGSADYWEKRYQAGGDSGLGSYDDLAMFKAEVINSFVDRHGVQSVIEFGCGDGNQLSLANYAKYLGLDVSSTAIERCRERFAVDAGKEFRLIGDYAGEKADMSMSLDVIYHLVEDATFSSHMEQLFGSAKRFVVIYSSNFERPPASSAPHVRHRCFTDWISAHRPDWTLVEFVQNRFPYNPENGHGSLADFHFFGKQASATS